MSRMRLAAALVVSTLALSACGSSDEPSSSGSGSGSGSSSSSSVAAATGDVVTGDDFSFNAPSGWKEKDPSSAPQINFLALAGDPDDKDGFPDNINILSDPTLTNVDSVDDLEKAIEKVLKGIAKDVTIEEPAQVAGDETAVASATFTQGTLKYKTIQYALRHNDKGYVVTFSFSEDRPEADRKKVAASVMASWKWSS